MEILKEQNYAEYEEYLQNNDRAMFLQSSKWAKVKDKFLNKIIVLRDENGKINASMSVLIRKIPLLPFSIMYSPRGPVCDSNNKDQIKALLNSAKELAKQYNCYTLKLDPNIPKQDEEFVRIVKDLGCAVNFMGDSFSGSIQPSVVYHLNINGRKSEELFSHFPYKTRYAIKSAQKSGVRIEKVGKEKLSEFYSLLLETSQRDRFTVRPISYFESMMDNMGEHLNLYIAYYENTPISGAILITYGNRSLHLYGASSNLHRDKMPNYLMQWEMMSFAIENNIIIYDFGGIAAVEDENNPLYGLFMFKRKFRGEVVEYVGEIEFVFKPFINKLINFAFDARKKLLNFKKGKRNWEENYQKNNAKVEK